MATECLRPVLVEEESEARRTPYERAQDAYAASFETVPNSANLTPITIGEDGASWYQEGHFIGGYAAFVEQNIVVNVRFEGVDIDGAHSTRPMAEEEAEENAVLIAAAIAETL